ncbi:IS21-like element helper ATPase IstB [Conchiformibius steedae DSM 2580]|nr:IS21-like element helper ATPase IstB [Conchiformibius steedae]QMT32616.1 ATP-binding protein [Conchiformibius steedae]QMT33954.1 ATP-binding protein [Conchiformibius steedae]URD66723.1 IS21-like element helper ATPase IstB [Conchiformibius steedae DSM 2580]
MNEEIYHICTLLKLRGMAEEYQRQTMSVESREASFDSRFLSILLAERHHQANRRIQRLLKQAHFKVKADIHQIDYHTSRGVDATVFANLTGLEWLKAHQNICFTGPSGVGKTWLACALGHEACMQGIPTVFKKVSLLLEELVMAQIAGNLGKAFNALGRFPLLILDDWALEAYKPEEQKLLFELIDERHNSHSTIITSLLPMNHWHDMFDNKGRADSMMDRLFSNTHRINLQGASMRKMQPLRTEAG